MGVEGIVVSVGRRSGLRIRGTARALCSARPSGVRGFCRRIHGVGQETEDQCDDDAEEFRGMLADGVALVRREVARDESGTWISVCGGGLLACSEASGTTEYRRLCSSRAIGINSVKEAPRRTIVSAIAGG